MKTRIVQIGNSRGIRIPKLLLESVGLQTEVDLSAENGTLVIRPARPPRGGWAQAFRQMAGHGDDASLADIPTTLSEWDEEEWEWR